MSRQEGCSKITPTAEQLRALVSASASPGHNIVHTYRHFREKANMSSFSINAILGTRNYEDNEVYGTQNMKNESYSIQKSKARKLTDTDDEGVTLNLFYITI